MDWTFRTSTSGNRPAPQRARREYDAEGAGYPERIKRPDEEECSLGPFDADAGSHHMDDRHAERDDRADKNDDEAPPPVAPQKRRAEVDDEYGDAEEVRESSRGETQHDVLRDVERQQ